MHYLHALAINAWISGEFSLFIYNVYNGSRTCMFTSVVLFVYECVYFFEYNTEKKLFY